MSDDEEQIYNNRPEWDSHGSPRAHTWSEWSVLPIGSFLNPSRASGMQFLPKYCETDDDEKDMEQSYVSPAHRSELLLVWREQFVQRM